MPIVGNLWVSLFCGGAVMVVAVPDLILKNSEIIRPALWMYVAFAFLTTWYREIVKDIEDLSGDQKMKCNTFVVRYGAKAGKYMALFFSLVIMALLVWWEVTIINPSISWMLTILQGSVVASMAFVWWARDHSYIQTASLVIKMVMLAGTAMLFFI
jgi:4-hydroxybenzoate polyprenyltransferase